MSFDQAQSPRLGQRTSVESTSVQMFSGGEVPEAAWPGQLIYINEDQILQIFNGSAWEDVTGGDLGQLTFIGPSPPVAQNVGDVWFNSADANRMYVAKSAGADQVAAGEWEVISGTPPPITPTTYIYRQDNPPTGTSSPPPKDNDFWYETPNNKQYYYKTSAPGTHWIFVQDTGIPAAQSTADAAAASAAAASSSAAAANTAASNAMTAAQQAQATADGSIVTYYSAAPPWVVLTPSADPSFEVGVNGYTLTGTSPAGSSITSDATRARTGTKSLKMTVGGTQGQCAFQKTFTGITVGKTYTVLGWAYAPSGITAGVASISIRIGGATVSLAYNTPANATRNAWTPITTTYTAVASGTLTQYFYGSSGANESTWWDDAVVVEGTVTPNNVGDMWYDTATNKAYRWSGVDWAVITDTQVTAALAAAQNAQTTADGKITAYYQTAQPAVGKLGDLWYDTDDKNKPYYCSKEAPLTWTIVQDGTIADAQNTANQAIKSTVVEYSVAASETVAPTTGWSTNTPIRTPGSFIWTRTTTTKNDNTTSTSNPVLLTGNSGAPGAQGSQGIPGPSGSNGQSLFTWLKYSDTPLTGMSDFPAGKTYMGIAYNKASATESVLYSDYDWSLIQGPQGNTGVAGPAGSNGQPTYTWIKYADSATGTGMVDMPGTKAYIGFAYNKTTPAESNNPTDYEWSLIQGPQGPPGQAGSQGIQGPAGPNGSSLYTWLKYADTPTTGMSDLPAGKTYMGISYNQANATESTSYGAYDWSLIQGPQGNTGVAGPPGPNGAPTYTWIKYGDTPFGGGLSDSPVGKAYIGIAYNKSVAAESAIPTDYEWALIQGPQGSQGIQGPKGADGVQLYTWLKYADTPTTGMNDSPTGKTYMGLAYNKNSATESTLYSDYSWSLIVGPQGAQGVQGVAGPTGPNGQPTYTWIKYGTSATGAGINDSPVGMSYIGIAYNKTTAVESNLTTDYEWSLILGPQGPTGPTGSTGPQGIPGPAGANGQPLYTWVKYADTPTTGMSDLPTGKYYMGLAYNKTSATESNLYTDYDWSLIQGPQGNTGVQGPPGPNGLPTYTWIKYADTVTGTGLSDLPTNKTYLGIAYNKTTAAESTIATDYEWSLIQGPQGPQGSQGIQGPKGVDGIQLYTWVKYADTPTTGMNDLPAGKVYMGIAYNKTIPTESSIYSDYEWSLIQGPQGNTGIQGPVGPNGQPTYTWIKYADSITGAGLNDSPVGKTYLGIAYNKTTAVESSVTTDYEWSLIQGPQGATGATGPTGPPGLPGATVAPPASPAITLVPQDNGFVVQTGPIDIYSNLAYHCSTTTNFVPGPTTVVLSSTRNQNVLITAQNGGAAFVRGTTYYFKVIESNNIGAAPASAQASGQLRVWTQTDIPDLAKAVTDSTNALANAATAQTAATNALQQDSLSSNPIFNAWASTRPDGWTTTSAPAGSTFTKETTLVRTAPNAVRFSVGAVTQTYIAAGAGGAWATLPNLEYITLTFDFMLVSGDLNNAGAMIRWTQDVSFKVVYVPLNPSFVGAPPTLGQWYRVTRTIQRPTLSGAFVRIDPYLCGGYSLMEAGSVTAKDIIFDQFAVRPSTAEEITAYNTPASIAKSATDLQAYVQSRAYNLVTNGSGALGTNQNYSICTFDSTDAPTGANGCFRFPSGQGVRMMDELIPVDPNKVYEYGFDLRQQSGQGNFYGAVQTFDSYGLIVNPTYYLSQPNTLTTLAQQLNPGDTKITLASAANWNNTSGTTHLRSMITWNYVDQGGKAWPANTYSRYWSGADTWAIGGITGNVITLNAPWSGAMVPAGTQVSNGMSANAYMYMVPNQPGTANWTHYSGRTIKGALPTGGNVPATFQFPVMVARVKLGHLANYPVNTNSVQAVGNISFAEVTAGDDALAAAGVAKTTADLAQTSANGKNRVNYGAAAPTTANAGIPGDIWWVRTGNTIVGQYLCTVGTGTGSGNTWVEQTLTNATIATLDAAKINTGYLNSARIDVNSLNVGQISGLSTTLGTLFEMTPIPTLTANSPVGGSIAWPAFTIKHKGNTLSVPLGSTVNSWVIYRWNNGSPLIEQSDQQPAMGVDDFILFANSNGIGLRIFAAVLVTGDMIIDGSVTANAIGAGAIEAQHIHSDAIDASMINTGTMSATVIVGGSLAVGTGITINPTDGIKVKGPLGDSTIPATGAGMVLKGELTASALNISGNFKMTGTTNEIATGASMVVQAGITPPSSGPQITSEYPKYAIPLGYDTRGFVAFPAEDSASYLTTETLAGGVITKLVKNYGTLDFDPGLATFDMEAVRPEIQSAMGGITVLGTEVYTLCQTTEKVPGTSKKRWYRYQWHWVGGATRFAYVTRWLFEPSNLYGGNSEYIPTIGTDGTDILTFQCNKDGLWGVHRHHATSGALLDAVALWNDAAKTNRLAAQRNGSGIVGTPADLGGAMYWWIATTAVGQVYCFNGTGVNLGIRVTANEFTMPSQPLSLHWDGTRFGFRDETTVFDFSQIKDTDLATNPIKAVQTWRLNNDADTATAEAGDYATYETAKSGTISTSVALIKRAWMRLTSTTPIPDDPNDINDPDSLSFYVARGLTPVNTDFKRIPPFTGANKGLLTVLRDTLPIVGGYPPAITAWGPVTSGKVVSTTVDAAGPVWALQGSGVWRMGPFSGGANGLQTSRVPVCLGRWRATAPLTAAVGTEFAAGNLNNISLRTGMSYRMEWRALISNGTAASTSQTFFKYGAGLTNTGGTAFGEGQLDHRAAAKAITVSDFAVLDWAGADNTVVNFVATIISAVGASTVQWSASRAALLEIYEYPT